MRSLPSWHTGISPSFELAERDRVKVVPSSAYEELALHGPEEDFLVRRLLEMELVPFVIPRRSVVVVIVPTQQVVFVAIRGTVFLYDWVTNINAFKTTLSRDKMLTGRFHRGFYNAIVDCFDPIFAELRKHPNVPVYVTGHSLGGAMSAILHAAGELCRNCGRHHQRNSSVLTHSAYTCGMARYADDAGVQNFPCPYHLFKREDLIPRVPSQLFGYANSLNEFKLDGTPIVRPPNLEIHPFLTWSWRLARWHLIKEHSIESYRAALIEFCII